MNQITASRTFLHAADLYAQQGSSAKSINVNGPMGEASNWEITDEK
jgi:hypothetical protein